MLKVWERSRIESKTKFLEYYLEVDATERHFAFTKYPQNVQVEPKLNNNFSPYK